MVRYNEQKSPRKLKSNSDFWEAGTISQKSTIYVVHFVDSDDVKNGGRHGDSVCWKKVEKKIHFQVWRNFHLFLQLPSLKL